MYTFLSILSVFTAIILDRITKTNLLKNKKYYLFLVLIIFFKLLVNGALTAQIVMYDPVQITGLRIMTIPLEDFGFGFAMVMCAVIVWEKLQISA
jgi:lycopene cyclase domain-containing protein